MVGIAPKVTLPRTIRIVRSDAGAGDIDLIENGAGMWQEGTPGFRQTNATTEPVEELGAEFFLKLQHLL